MLSILSECKSYCNRNYLVYERFTLINDIMHFVLYKKILNDLYLIISYTK